MGTVTGKVRRKGGQLSGEDWLVLTESQRTSDGWKHSCGHDVMQTSVTYSHRDGVTPLSGDGRARTFCVPFCPDCELKPLSGEFSDDVACHVTAWES